MSHIMLDLETISTLPNARIIAIGAVKFSSDKGIYDKFYQAVETPPLDALRLMPSHIDCQGFHVAAETVQWWTEQSAEARTVFSDPNAVYAITALEAFSQWALLEDPIKTVQMWGNGASFDNVILSSGYRLLNLEQPWFFWNDNCYRTMKKRHPNVQLERIGTHHNALADAETQAEHLLKMGVELL